MEIRLYAMYDRRALQGGDRTIRTFSSWLTALNRWFNRRFEGRRLSLGLTGRRFWMMRTGASAAGIDQAAIKEKNWMIRRNFMFLFEVEQKCLMSFLVFYSLYS